MDRRAVEVGGHDRLAEAVADGGEDRVELGLAFVAFHRHQQCQKPRPLSGRGFRFRMCGRDSVARLSRVLAVAGLTGVA